MGAYPKTLVSSCDANCQSSSVTPTVTLLFRRCPALPSVPPRPSSTACQPQGLATSLAASFPNHLPFSESHPMLRCVPLSGCLFCSPPFNVRFFSSAIYLLVPVALAIELVDPHRCLDTGWRPQLIPKQCQPMHNQYQSTPIDAQPMGCIRYPLISRFHKFHLIHFWFPGLHKFLVLGTVLGRKPRGLTEGGNSRGDSDRAAARPLSRGTLSAANSRIIATQMKAGMEVDTLGLPVLEFIHNKTATWPVCWVNNTRHPLQGRRWGRTDVGPQQIRDTGLGLGLLVAAHTIVQPTTISRQGWVGLGLTGVRAGWIAPGVGSH